MSHTVTRDVIERFALWRCREMGWHPRRGRVCVSHDGASSHARCARCGYEGLVDSQGNLF